ncbi:MAG: hypothetical protein HZA52_13790 [Planctomycetes bacterium]|nr:hypothetical protein [Planctomycetota bacterium]
MKLQNLVSFVIALSMLGACRSSWYPHRFAPAPLEVSLDSPRVEDAKGRALVTVLGIRREDFSKRSPAQVEIRMRVENAGERKLAVQPESFRLVSATLEDFGAPYVVGLPDQPLAKDQSAVFEVQFALPDGKEPNDLGLAGLNLKWEVDFEGERVGTGITFERRNESYPYTWYHDPFYAPYGDPWCVHSHMTVIGHAHDD